MNKFTFYVFGYSTTEMWCYARANYRSWMPQWDYPIIPVKRNTYETNEACFNGRTFMCDVRQVCNDLIYFYQNFRRNSHLDMYHLTHSPVTYDTCHGDEGYYDFYFYPLLFFLTWFPLFMIAFCFTYLSLMINEHYRWIISYLVWTTNSINISPSFFRSAFNSAVYTTKPPVVGHTHGVAANNRNNDTSFMVSVCSLMGRTPYFAQCSAANLRKSLSGSRDYYWPKDITVPPMLYDPPLDSVICMMDVDMYYNMPVFLAHNNNPILIATVQPTECADVCENFSFTHDENNIMEYTVSGGGRFKHPWWNYQQDTITAIATCCGIPYKLRTYFVDRRTTSKHHDVILLTPSGSWGFWTAVATWLFGTTPLTRAKLFQATHLRLMIQTSENLFMSTAVPRQHLCATIPKRTDDMLANLVVSSKTGLQRTSIDSALPKEVEGQVVSNREKSTVLYDYHIRNGTKLSVSEWAAACTTYLHSLLFNLPRPQLTCPNPAQVRSYMIGKFYDVAKPTMFGYMQPVIPGSFAPLQTKTNEEVAIEERITKVKSTVKTTPFLETVIDEFLNYLVPSRSILVPLTYEEVSKRQSRPTQQAILNQAQDTIEPLRKAKTFIKQESYSDIKPPRIITTYNPSDKQDYSAFTYAISDWMKDREIPYAFGRSPAEVAESIAKLCQNAEFVVKSDFTKFDGHISEPCRLLELLLLYRLFPNGYHEELQDLHRAQYNLFATCTLGTKYNTGLARGSGSPETSIFNSIINMFATFLAHRMTKVPNGMFIGPSEAWERMNNGMYGGDDGLSPNLDPDYYQTACASLGLVVKAEKVLRGHSGVQFLARDYGPDVWVGDPTNMADLPRQLSKLHASTIRGNDVSPKQILVEKMMGFIVTDTNTPFLGKFAERVLGFKSETKYDVQHLSYNVRRLYDLETSINVTAAVSHLFHNDPADWYEPHSRAVLPGFDFDAADAWIEQLSSLDDCLLCPGFQEFKPVTPKDDIIYVDDETILPKKKSPHEETRLAISSVQKILAPKLNLQRHKELIEKEKIFTAVVRHRTNNKLPTSSTIFTNHKSKPTPRSGNYSKAVKRVYSTLHDKPEPNQLLHVSSSVDRPL